MQVKGCLPQGCLLRVINVQDLLGQLPDKWHQGPDLGSRASELIRATIWLKESWQHAATSILNPQLITMGLHLLKEACTLLLLICSWKLREHFMEKESYEVCCAT